MLVEVNGLEILTHKKEEKEIEDEGGNPEAPAPPVMSGWRRSVPTVSAVAAQVPACGAGVEFVADAIERSDAAVALRPLVQKTRIVWPQGVQYHVEALGLIVQCVHTKEGKMADKAVFSLCVVENAKKPSVDGEGSKTVGEAHAEGLAWRPTVYAHAWVSVFCGTNRTRRSATMTLSPPFDVDRWPSR
jgi:hypothetical protein